MSFTSVTVSGVIAYADGTDASGVTVKFQLSKSITDGVTLVEPSILSATTNSEGEFSLTVDANDDPTTTPTGSFYTCTITSGINVMNTLEVVIPHAGGGTQNLFSLVSLQNG